MKKVFGIDLGTTYSCIAYIDESGKPRVLKNAEDELTTPSVVYFESENQITVGSAAKESAVMYPDQVVTFIKRDMGKPGFRKTVNDIDMSPEEISSYILKKVVADAENTLRMENKLGEDEHIKDVVITCPAYFGVPEREATKKAGEFAGLNVMNIINEPTAAAIAYGVTDDEQEKTVLVYDLGGGTFDITMIQIQPDGKIRVICTGGNDTLGGKDWDDCIIRYLAEHFQNETGIEDDILDDAESLQDLTIAAERAKILLTAKPKAPISIHYMGEKDKVDLTREKFDELTETLLDQTIDLTRDMFREAERKGFSQSDVEEILLVGGSSKMPQVMKRVQEEFGIKTSMFDPNEAVAKGAAIFADKIVDEPMGGDDGKHRLPGTDPDIINVSSRSYGTEAYDATDTLKLFNIIRKNDEIPAEATNSFYPRTNNQKSVKFSVKESLSSDEVIDPKLGREIGFADLMLPPGVTKDTEIKVTFRLDESGLLHLHAKEMKDGREVEAEFQTTEAMSEEDISDALRRVSDSDVN